MKVHCPDCSAQIAAANLNLDTGWGKCVRCNDLFPLAQVVPAFPTAQSSARSQRPFDARAVVERSSEELRIHIPAQGMRAATLGMFGFATFWLGFIAFWTAGALGVFGGEQPGTFNLLFASFSIPFWIVGFGMLAGVAWSAWGTKFVRLDRSGLRTQQRCLLWSWSHAVELAEVQRARLYEPAVKSEGARQHAVEIVYCGGSFVLPADSGEEEKWLLEEINEFRSALALS